MPSTTLQSYRTIGPSWAVPDCEHPGALWFTDINRANITYRDASGELLFYCTADCRHCKRRVYGAFTAGGRVRVVFREEPKEMK